MASSGPYSDDIRVTPEIIDPPQHEDLVEVVENVNDEAHYVPKTNLTVTSSVRELLECPVCLNAMYPPIHQCSNGHTLCSGCKPRVHNRCPTCRHELGNIRCLALEKVAASLEMPCKYQTYGCMGIYPYYSKLKHESQCVFRPYSCPYAGSECTVVGDIPSLVSHLKDDHKVDMHIGSTFNHRYVKSNPHEVENATWMLTTSAEVDFFTEYGEGSRYKIEEVIGKGSYGVVCSAYDTHTGDKVAIKKINDIFEHVSDATRILREIKLLRLLRHPDIVEIKHILLPPSRREFKDIYVVFELMESDLHQVIKANDDLTLEHYQFFLYQLLRGLKYIHTANVFHRDLKPKNILANADCKLKICDFGLARVAFHDTPTAIFWTDYVATRWYRAPELCGSFFSKYTPAIDIWSIGCIFAELLTGKPLFPGKNVVHQLDLMTELLGTPSAEAIARVRNEKARRYLSSMRRKKPIPFSQKFPNADPLALRLLEKMLAFEPKDRPTAEEALADPYFRSIARVEREPSAQPVTKMEFEFERRRITKEDVRELIYRETLEYHPKMLKEFLEGTETTGFMYPSAVDHFKKQFAFLEEQYGNGAQAPPPERQHASLPRACVFHPGNTPQNSADIAEDVPKCYIKEADKPQQDTCMVPVTRVPLQVPQRVQGSTAKPGKVIGSVLRYNSSTTAAAEVYEQRRGARVPAIPSQCVPSGSYPRRNPGCKGERGDDDGMEGMTIVQPKTYIPRKATAANVGPSGHW